MSGTQADTNGRRSVAGEPTTDGFYRVCVKLYGSDEAIDDHAKLFVPIFHDWIREHALEGLVLLDVADYAHAPDSPGIMLICHEANFSMDRTDGRFGLLAQRRVPVDGSAVDAVAKTLRHALQVASHLESDARVNGSLGLDPSALRFEANDRLRLPNSQAGYEAFAPIVEEAIAKALGGIRPAVTRVENDPRDRLTVEASLDGAPDVREILAALTPIVPGGSV
jgi:hypothetical protein